MLKFGEGLERGAATAYLGVIRAVRNRELAKLTASILGIAATHVTTLALALQEQTAYGLFVARLPSLADFNIV